MLAEMKSLNGMIILLILITVSGFPGAAQLQSNDTSDFQEFAIRYVSTTHGIPASRLLIAYEEILELPVLGRRYWNAKVIDMTTMNTYGLTLPADLPPDARNLVRYEKIVAAEYRARLQKFGKRTSNLDSLATSASADTRITVGIWLYTPTPGPSGRKGPLEQVYESTSQIQAGPVDFLKSHDALVKFQSRLAPLIFAEIPVDLLKRLEARDDVMMLDVDAVAWPELDVSAKTIGADVVHGFGVTGSGAKVAVVEAGNIRLSHVNLPSGLSRRPGDAPTEHMTHIAGVVASTHAIYTGVATGLDGSARSPQLLSANADTWSTSDLIAAIEWAIDRGADIISNSYYTDTSLNFTIFDMYFDHVIYWHGRLMVKSAGNRGTVDGNVTSPGKGYNTLTVGAFDDGDTVPWFDDALADFSSYVDPRAPNGDRPEKPEVVAPGVNIVSTCAGSDTDFCSLTGTSASTPHVVGLAALLISSDLRLARAPEAVKAIVLATAVHNLEGASRLSEKDGTGGIYARYAYDTVRHGQWMVGWFGDSGSSRPFSYRIFASAGQRLRVAMVFDSQPPHIHPPATDPRLADLDLHIIAPDGTFLTSSASLSSTFEIVDFRAPKTGYYKAVVRKISAVKGWTGTYIGLAWWVGSKGNPLSFGDVDYQLAYDFVKMPLVWSNLALRHQSWARRRILSSGLKQGSDTLRSG